MANAFPVFANNGKPRSGSQECRKTAPSEKRTATRRLCISCFDGRFAQNSLFFRKRALIGPLRRAPHRNISARRSPSSFAEPPNCRGFPPFLRTHCIASARPREQFGSSERANWGLFSGGPKTWHQMQIARWKGLQLSGSRRIAAALPSPTAHPRRATGACRSASAAVFLRQFPPRCRVRASSV